MCIAQYRFLVCSGDQNCWGVVTGFGEHRQNWPVTLVSANEIRNSTRKSVENEQNLSAKDISAQTVKFEGNSVDVIQKELWRYIEKESPPGHSLNSVVLRQTFDIETRGRSYIMDVKDERLQHICRNVIEQVGVLISLSCSSILDKVMNSPSLRCDETLRFVCMFFDNL